MAILLVDLDFDPKTLDLVARLPINLVQPGINPIDVHFQVIHQFCQNHQEHTHWRLNYTTVQMMIDRLQNVIDFFVIHSGYTTVIDFDDHLTVLESLMAIKASFVEGLNDLDQRLNPDYWEQRRDL